MSIFVVQVLRHSARGKHFSIERVFEDVRRQLPSDIEATQYHAPELSVGLLPRLRNALAVRQLQAPIVHLTGDINYAVAAVPRSSKVVLTVHDLASVDRLSGGRQLVYEFFWFLVPLWRADVVTAVSETTAAALRRRYPWVTRKLKTIENPLSRTFRPIPSNDMADRKYRLLQIGTGPNKNLDSVIAALSGLDVELTVVGHLDSKFQDRLRATGIESRLREDLTDDELLAEYSRCDAVIFASTFEGFGLPILEAQAVGRPVICSGIEPMTSVAGSGALLVDPLSIESIRSAIVKLKGSKELAERLIRLGTLNARRFSPQRAAAGYAELYRGLVKE